jgi:hypothetical protein
LSAATAFSALPKAVMTATGTSNAFCVMYSTTPQPFAVGQSHVGQAQVERLAIEQSQRVVNRLGARRVESHSR